MAKQGMHKDDSRDQRKSRGPNKPSESVTITTGTPKKKETFTAQAREHKATNKQPQAAKNEWKPDTREPGKEDKQSRQRRPNAERSGSDSGAGRTTQRKS